MMGVLGPGLYRRRTGPMPVINKAQHAQTLENQFRQSGIMHLMAVSGGHFVLVAAGLVRRFAHGVLAADGQCWSLEYMCCWRWRCSQ